jgi:hypothetical protein
MLVSADRLPACKTQVVLDAHAGVLTQDEFDARPASLAERRVAWCATRTSPCIWNNCPNLSKENQSFTHGMSAFAKGVLGPEAGVSKVHVACAETHRRMLLADVAFLLDTEKNRPSSVHAATWQKVTSTAVLDKRQVLIDACAAWHPELQELTAKQCLDVLAGVTEQRTCSTLRKASVVDHVVLNDRGDGRYLGSVFHLKNIFSPGFIRKAMGTGIPALPFMRDGMKKSKDRLARMSHDVPGTPFRLRKENPFLMLSDTAQSFEADMLKIGNFLNSHLHAHVHQHVARHHGKAAAKLVVPPLVHFEMIQSAVNSMTDSGHGWHDDSGSFVSDNTLEHGDEDHNMIVPAFIWSNRGDVSTNVTCAQKGQKSNSKTTETLTAECHMQTSGVQAN